MFIELQARDQNILHFQFSILHFQAGRKVPLFLPENGELRIGNGEWLLHYSVTTVPTSALMFSKPFLKQYSASPSTIFIDAAGS